MILPKLTSKLKLVYGHSVRLRSLALCKDGRKRVDLIVNGKQKTCLLARLKLEAKLGRKLGKQEVDHIDGDKTNDSYRNLQALSKTKNVLKQNPASKLKKFLNSPDGKFHLRNSFSGEDNSQAKLSNTEAFEARELYSKGYASLEKLAKEFSMSKRSIIQLLEGKTYKEAGGPLAKVPRRRVGRPPRS